MAMQNVFNILVDLKVARSIDQPLVTQNDSVVFILEVVENGVPFDLTDTTTVSLAHTRKDQTVVVTPGTKLGNKATFVLGTNETAVAGSVVAKAQFYDADGRVSTLSFSYTVGSDPTGSDYVPSEVEQTLIQIILNDGPLIIQSAEEAAAYANEQGDYALQVATDNKIIPLATVDTVALRNSTYPSPLNGSLVTVTQGANGNAETYRFVTGTGWVLVDKYNGTTITNITSQLADMSVQPYSRDAEVLASPRVTFYFDDGNPKEISRILPIANTEGIVLNAGVFYEDNLGAIRITDAQIVELQNIHGWEIDCHTYNHYSLTSLTEQQIDDQFRLNKAWLQSIGIDVKNTMYPKGHRDKRVTKAARKYYRSGLGSQQQINKLPLDTYDIKRITLDTNDITFLKAKVDEAILEKGWVVFYGHSGIWEEARFAMFQELIQYVKTKSVPIVTVSQALDVLENKLDVGDIELGNGFKVGSDGSLSATNIPHHYAPAVADLQNKPITFFKPFKITVMAFNSSSQSGIIGYKNAPMSAGSGTLITNRLFALDDTFASQMFYGYNGEIYKRTWNQSTLLWNDWKDINVVVELRGLTGASLVSAFPHKKITVSTFLTADNSGIPLSNGIGTLTTNRMGEDPLMHFQTWKGYLSDVIHVRRWISGSNAWGAWTGLIKNIASSVALGDVAANSYKTVVHTVTGVKAGVIQAQPLGHLTDGISIESIVAGVDTVSIKVYNRTAGTISLGTRSFYFTQE